MSADGRRMLLVVYGVSFGVMLFGRLLVPQAVMPSDHALRLLPGLRAT